MVNENLRNFRRWYKKAIILLQGHRAFGYPLLCISLPLLERYLRQKSGIYQRSSLNNQFYGQFLKLFPEIRNIDEAKDFWVSYRHGLLHQAAPKMRGPGSRRAAVSHDYCLIRRDDRRNLFIINPKKFSSRVVDIIENDFSTYEGTGSFDHPLPKLRR